MSAYRHSEDISKDEQMSSPTEKPTVTADDNISVDAVEQDQVFAVAKGGKGGVEFRGVSWLGAAFLIAKLQFGLGVLGIPSTFETLGLFPGIVVLIVLSAITTWTGLIVGDYRLKHPAIYGIPEAAGTIFGRPGKEIMGVFFWILYTFCYGSAALTFSKALNLFTDHSQCTLAFIAYAALISLVLGSATRTLKWMSWCSYFALASVFCGVWVTTIACLAQKRPAAAPATGPVDKDIHAFVSTKLWEAMPAVTTQLFSLGGTPSLFNIHAEMKNPREYKKSLILGQGFVVVNYFVVSLIMYGRVGQYVTSPALASAGPHIAKIAYGVSVPALLYSCFYQAHLAAKYTFVRTLRNSIHLQKNSAIHWTVWLTSLIVSLAVGWVVAAAIPFFGDLLGLIGAFLMPSFTMIIPVCLYLAMYVEKYSPDVAINGRMAWVAESWRVASRQGGRVRIATYLCYLIAIAGAFLFVVGTYGSVYSIIEEYKVGAYGKGFSCTDNY